ncbi:MATE family efflux transporter [Ectobacillus antri]|jgi:MATE family multidrug resistance protein|uniref:Probable multidrug resistance protein NorM n=1 Tax=Ectobacillus antri TaxID=2486280 RepID=A0ABT6H4M0_9BACI|nr:MATE family efflux transporter [Ectobacillus antri]MDG4656905.1 MATE family efflux transporter [Ectobacillus antri]MDG5754198.1 MATE family efflux transporter [Ectobacillus antri]
MIQTTTFTQKLKQFFILFFPVFVTQITLFSMSFFDTMMSGRASSADLAGVAIGTSIWIPASTGLTGILLAVTPTVAQLKGAKREHEVAPVIMQAIYLAIAAALLVILIGIFAVSPILNHMKLESNVRTIAANFLLALSFGIVPLFVYTVLRCFIDALGKTRVTMFITLLSLPINILLNFVLIFGKFGFPRLGGVGAGIASAVTYWCILLIATYMIHTKHPFAPFGIFKRLYRVSFAKWKELLKLGVPIGFAIFFETSIFAAVTLLMSSFDTNTIAAHQAALNFASMLYMTPLSLAMAMTIAVGFEVGANRLHDAKVYSWLGIGIALVFALLYSVVIFVFGEQVAAIYTTDPVVRELAQQFLLYAILFQISDAIATPVQGALRGYKDVNAALIMTLIAYWVIGLPLGHLLAIQTDLAAKGYWVGLISGLAFGALFLSMRLLYVQKKTPKEAAA